MHECQTGFRQKHSCQNAFVRLIDQWLTCIDIGDIIGTLFVDVRRAFDLVDHSILVNKLSLYKFSPLPLGWFQSYLSSRRLAIACDEFANVNSGVPKGSILGPTLILLFIDILLLLLKHWFSDFFADDASLYTHSKSVSVIENNILNDFNETKQLSKYNKVTIDYNKTTCMTAGPRNRLSHSRQMEQKLDDIHVQNATKQKLLGVYIDENLNWSAHIDYLCSTITSKLSLLRQLSEYVSTDVQKLFFQSYIMPLIDHGSVVLGSTSSSNLNSGQLIFKYVFSKIFHYNHRCDQQNYISLEVVTRPFNKKYKMSNKD